MIRDNILSTKSNTFGILPGEVSKDIAIKARARRLEMNLSQSALAKRSGVSLGTLKRFERTAEISLKNLLQLAAAMDSADGFTGLFAESKYSTFEEAVEPVSYGRRKRGRLNE
jgi:transcriptional regulator with XRE-family HTH domain